MQSRPYDAKKWYEHFLPVLTRLRLQERRNMKTAKRDLERVGDDPGGIANIDRALYGIPVITQELCKAHETMRLCRQAGRLLVWIPNHPRPAVDAPDDVFWEQGGITGYWYFSAKGFEEVRQKVRQERAATWETMNRWVVLMIGLLGAATGLAATLLGD